MDFHVVSFQTFIVSGINIVNAMVKDLEELVKYTCGDVMRSHSDLSVWCYITTHDNISHIFLLSRCKEVCIKLEAV